MKKTISAFMALLTMFTMLFGFTTNAYAYESYTYLDTLNPVQSGRYTGNCGDSNINKIKVDENDPGKKDIYGNRYEHGLQAWIARFNNEAEISWAYNIYELNGKYNKLTGKTVLLESYNTNNFDTTLYFYGDGKLLKSYKMTPGNIPFNFSVNVEGVKRLKVYLKDNSAVCGGTLFGLTGCKLYKPYIVLSENQVVLNVSNTKTIEYTLKGATEAQANQTAYWSSSNTNVAKVSSKGKIVAIGTGTCLITCKVGTAKKSLRVIVRPKKVQNFAVSSKTTTSVTFKWNRLDNVTGYRIYMYDSDIQEYTYVKTVDGAFRTTTVKGLKKGRTYKFKIRAYVKVNGKNYYGAYSDVLKVTTKR